MRVAEAVVMAGGRGSRMGYVVKPLVKVCGKPMVHWVVRAAENVVGRVVVAVSPTTSGPVATYLRERFGPAVECVETPGTGYVEDLALILKCVRLPALVLPADTPAVTPATLEEFLRKTSALKPLPAVITLDAGSGPVGISIFTRESGGWATVGVAARGLINVNTWGDVRLVEQVMCGGGGGEGL